MASKKTDETETVEQTTADGGTLIRPSVSTGAPSPKGEGYPAGDESESGTWCYIGPNIKKVIQTGTLYYGTRAQALEQAAQAMEKEPGIRRLIVSGEKLAEARQKLKAGGNALSAAYEALKKH